MTTDFDFYSEGYREIHNRNISITGADSSYFARFKAQKVVDFYKLKKTFSGNILDFGCGDGALINHVKELLPQANCYGVDVSEGMLEVAKKKFSSLCYFSTVCSNLSAFKDSFFDLIVVANVFHHIRRTEWRLWLEEIIRVTKNGGAVLFFEHNPLNPLTKYLVQTCPFDAGVKLIFPSELVSSISTLLPSMEYKIEYLLFVPRWHPFSRIMFLEKILRNTPFGGQYLLAVKKPS